MQIIASSEITTKNEQIVAFMAADAELVLRSSVMAGLTCTMAAKPIHSHLIEGCFR
jgi:hypothetical protein